MKKVAIFGVKGMLGYAVCKYFTAKKYQVVALGREEFDIAKDPFEKVNELLSGIDLVINCAGVIKPMIASTALEVVLKVNAIFPRNLANFCEEKNIACFHITTDCVYSGQQGNYNEKSYFDAEDIYGMTKNAGEPSQCMVLRTSIIGEEQGQSRSLLEWAKSQKGKEVNGFLNHNWNGVTTTYLAEIIENIYSTKGYQKGIFHIHSPKPVNKHELVSLLGEVYNLDLKVKPVNAEVLCDRTLSSVFAISEKYCTKSIPNQIQEMKEFFLNPSNCSSD